MVDAPTNYSKYTIQELKSMIRSRKSSIKSIYRVAGYMTQEQLVPYERMVREIEEMKKVIKSRKARLKVK